MRASSVRSMRASVLMASARSSSSRKLTLAATLTTTSTSRDSASNSDASRPNIGSVISPVTKRMRAMAACRRCGSVRRRWSNTLDCNTSARKRCSALGCALLPRSKTTMPARPGTSRTSFSSTTLAMNPVVPVRRTRLPAKARATSSVPSITDLSVARSGDTRLTSGYSSRHPRCRNTGDEADANKKQYRR